MDDPLIATLRTRRLALGLSKQAVHERACINRSTFDKYESTGRCAVLEKVERWAATLGYQLALQPIKD